MTELRRLQYCTAVGRFIISQVEQTHASDRYRKARTIWVSEKAYADKVWFGNHNDLGEEDHAFWFGINKRLTKVRFTLTDKNNSVVIATERYHPAGLGLHKSCTT
jgi:hypothetical protein